MTADPMAEDAVTDAGPNMGINGVDKDMTSYLHYVNDTETSKTVIDKSTWYYSDTTQEWNDANVTIRVSAAQQTLKWYLYPVLAADFTVNSFDFIIWAQRIAGAGHPNKVISIYEKTKDGETLIHSKNHGAGPGIVVTPTEQVWDSDAAWGGHTFKAGSSIVMVLDMNPGAGNTFDLIFDTASADSRVVFNSDDSMDIQSVYLVDSEDQSRRDLDPTALNKSVRFRANVTDPLGGYDIEWVNLTLKDPLSATILDNVTMRKVVGNPNTYLNIYEKEWNYSTYPAGTYDVLVWALDHNGYFYKFYDGNLDFDDYYVEKEWNFSIGEISYLNVKVVDSKDVPLTDARVIATLNDSKIIEAINITNASGMVNMTLFSAEYEIMVEWADTLVALVVYDLVANVTEDSPLNITASVYYPGFKFKDGRDLPLENASITLVYPNGTVSRPFRTNETGEFDLTQVPGGTYRVLVRWRDILVNNTIIDIVDNSNHTLSTFVYYMKVIARDDLGGVLPGAQIVIANNTTTIVFDSKVTNLTGAITSRLPAGIYDLSIYWQNTMVYEELNISFFSDTTIDAMTGIFVLNITALDGHLVPVSKARVLVLTSHQNLLESNFTNEDGLVKSRLPKGAHTIRAYWREVLVNETIVNLTDNHDITLALSINYPTLKVIDEMGGAVANARVDIYYAGTLKLYGTGVTDEDGETVHRVPATTYDIRVTWYDRLVNETHGLVLDSDDVIVIGASVYDLGLEVVDPHDVAVANALVEVSFTGGDIIGAYTTDENGLTFLRLPADAYDIRALWYGVVVYEETGIQLSAGMDLTLVADIWYINVTPFDSRNVTLEDALITLRFSDDGALFGALSTGGYGIVVFRVPTSTFDIEITWEDHLVFNGTDLTFDADQVLDLRVDVFYLDVTVLDSKSLSLDGSRVTVMYADDRAEVAIWTVISQDTMGLRLPMDSYIIEVHWMTVLVNTTEVLMDKDIDIELKAWVHYLDLHLVDSRDIPLKDASVTVSLSTTGAALWTRRTDENGSVSFRLPGRTPLNITAVWSDIEVLDNTGYVLASDVTEVFHAAVYYVGLRLLDTKSIPLESAKVVFKVEANGRVMSTGMTSSDGTDEFRLPATTYVAESVWWGVRIYRENIVVSGDTTKDLFVDVSYLTIEVKDSRDVPVVAAWVNMALGATGSTLGAGLTDDNGTITTRLPHESYDITVYWNGVQVASDPSVQLQNDMTRTISAKIFYLDIKVMDDRQLPLEDAIVTVTRTGSNDHVSVAPTSPSGETTFRLPRGNYGLAVDWMDVQVASGLDAELEADVTKDINARVFYLAYRAKDGTGAGLKGVRVRIEDSGGHAMGEGVTDGKGTVEFRLPVGTYNAHARFITTHLMSDVDISKSSEVVLTSSMEHVQTFSDYPPPVYMTNAFLFGTLSLILIVLIVVVIVLGLRKRKAAEAPDEEDEDEYPPKDESEEGEEEEDEEDDATEDESEDADEDETEDADEVEEGEEEDEGPKDLESKMDEEEAPPEDTDSEESPLEKIAGDISKEKEVDE